MFFELNKLQMYVTEDGKDSRSAIPVYDHKDIPDSTSSMCIFIFNPGQSRSAHQHETQAEIYIPLSGHGELIVDGVLHELRPGTVSYVPPMTPHITLNPGTEPLKLLCIFSPYFSLDYVREWTKVDPQVEK